MPPDLEHRGDAVLTVREREALDFTSFFERESLRLGRAIFLLTGDAAEAEDLVQEAFARAYERWDRISTMAEPAGYVYRIASNLHRRRSRRNGRSRPLADAIGRASDALDPANAGHDVLAALATLSHAEREAIVLVELLGFDAEAAGGILGIKAGTVRVRLHRARAHLREALGGDDG